MATIRERIDAALQHELLTVEQVALLTQYDPQTIYRKVWRGTIPGVVRMGGSIRRGIRFRRDAIVPWAKTIQRTRTSNAF